MSSFQIISSFYHSPLVVISVRKIKERAPIKSRTEGCQGLNNIKASNDLFHLNCRYKVNKIKKVKVNIQACKKSVPPNEGKVNKIIKSKSYNTLSCCTAHDGP